MKTLLNRIFLAALMASALSSTLPAAELPDEASRELEKMYREIKRDKQETEKLILKKKQGTIRSLERIEKTIDNDFVKNLIKIQLVKFRKEVSEVEALVGGGDKEKEAKKEDDKSTTEAAKIIDFGKSYFYQHPMEKSKDVEGEFKFYTNGKVNCYHRKGSKVEMFKKWDWRMKDGKIEITADTFHGPIYVSKKSPSEVYLDWKGLINKKNVAKQK